MPVRHSHLQRTSCQLVGVLTRFVVEQPSRWSCQATAREHPASRPSHHASPLRSPSARGDLDHNKRITSARHVSWCNRQHQERSKQTWWKNWKPSLQTFFISSFSSSSHSDSSRFRFSLFSSSSSSSSSSFSPLEVCNEAAKTGAERNENMTKNQSRCLSMLRCHKYFYYCVILLKLPFEQKYQVLLSYFSTTATFTRKQEPLKEVSHNSNGPSHQHTHTQKSSCEKVLFPLINSRNRIVRKCDPNHLPYFGELISILFVFFIFSVVSIFIFQIPYWSAHRHNPLFSSSVCYDSVDRINKDITIQ